MLAGSLLGIHFCLFYTAITVMPNNIVNATVFGTMAPLFALLIEVYQGKKLTKINNWFIYSSIRFFHYVYL